MASEPLRYIITTHRHLTGVRLSKPGHWGNKPFASDEAAVQFVVRDATSRFTIDREHVNKVFPESLP